jgi:hypothetical protein
MIRRATILFAIGLFLSVNAYADYVVFDKGMWPESWPKQLESLRMHSKTLVGPTREYRNYAIPFTKREDFESTWPHILEVKSKGAPIVLRRGPSFWFDGDKKAGVCIHTPPEGEEPVFGDQIKPERLEQTIYIELIVDGEIIDLNRIPLPPDTPIIDERFQKPASK